MADILIRGMEMPNAKFGSMIVAIRPDGMVEDVMGCYVGKAVPVPLHGRLGDLDALAESVRNPSIFPPVVSSEVLAFLRNAPTIIPASE